MANRGIDGVVDFIRARDEKFAQQIQGASDAEIARLEAASGRTLPVVYRRFLERMGHGMGWLQIGAAAFEIDSMLRYWESDPLPDPPHYTMIGRGSGDPIYDYYLWETTNAAGALVHRLVSFTPPPIGEAFAAFARDRIRPIAGSLEQQLANAALSVFCHHRLPRHRQVEARGHLNQPRLAGLDAVLAPFHLHPLWFSDDWQRFYETPDCLVTALESPATGRLIVDVWTAGEVRFQQVYGPVREYVKGR